MEMTIEEIIAKETEIAQEFQKVIDNHIVGDNSSLEEMYCDDTEIIEEQLQRCKVFADYHNQIANTMRKYQKITEILKDDTYYEEYGSNAERFIVSAINEVLEDGRN